MLKDGTINNKKSILFLNRDYYLFLVPEVGAVFF